MMWCTCAPARQRNWPRVQSGATTSHGPREEPFLAGILQELRRLSWQSLRLLLLNDSGLSGAAESESGTYHPSRIVGIFHQVVFGNC